LMNAKIGISDTPSQIRLFAESSPSHTFTW
jgi:hypothetical protein